MQFDNVFLAFGLTLLAGLSTGIGSLIALIAKRTNTAFLSLALGFAAGAMIYVSMVEIYFQAQQTATQIWGTTGLWAAAAAFFAGMVFASLIDIIIPAYGNPHYPRTVEELNPDHPTIDESKLFRLSIFTALALVIHNFPEGIATFLSALQDPSLGIVIAIAIALHNIPEGIAVSVPMYYATGDRKKAFLLSFLSGLSEPIGAIIGYLILLPFLSDALMSLLFAAVAGIMVFISLDELLPAAKEYWESHYSIYGVIAGMLVMALSLLLI